MKSVSFFCFTILVALSSWVSPQIARCDTVNLTIDQTQSDADISINGSAFENSEVSGTGVLEIESCVDPFGLAQITALDLTLVEGLTFQLVGAQVIGTTQPGDVTISLDTPGAGSTVTGGSFDQLGNVMSLTGTLDIADPLGLIGGDQAIDLSTLSPSPVDFTNVQVSRVGDTKTIAGTFSITDDIEISPGVFIPFVANGSYVASGTAVPEPGSTVLIIGLAGLLGRRRRRLV